MERDPGAHEVRRGGRTVDLTAQELELLRFFLPAPRSHYLGQRLPTVSTKDAVERIATSFNAVMDRL